MTDEKEDTNKKEKVRERIKSREHKNLQIQEKHIHDRVMPADWISAQNATISIFALEID